MFDDPHLDRFTRLMDVASLRARVIAGNLANQNTPGYRTRAVDFEEAFREAIAGGKDLHRVEAKIYEPRDTSVGVDGNDVAVDREVLAGAQNAFMYDAYASVIRGRNTLINTAITSAP